MRRTRRLSFTFPPEELLSQLYYPHCLHCPSSDLPIQVNSSVKALLRGRLHLTQVEGLHDLIKTDNGATEVQREWALGSARFFDFIKKVFSPIQTRAEYGFLKSFTVCCKLKLIYCGEGEHIEEGALELGINNQFFI